MSWKEQLHPKDKYLHGGIKERSKRALMEQEGGYRNPPQKTGLGGKDCKVRKCSAISCKYNSNYQCTLSEIDIDTKGICKMFEKKGEPNLYYVA